MTRRFLTQQMISDLGLSTAAVEDIAETLKLRDMALESLLFDLMSLAELNPEMIKLRFRPILFQQCLIHLADDLADGDCSYLPNHQAQGPTVQCTLQYLVSLTLMDAQLKPQSIKNFYLRMLKVGSAQHEEIRIEKWTLARSKNAASGLNGNLFAAYFALIWADTDYEDMAVILGYHYGIAIHVATDIKSRDPRHMQLSLPDRESLRNWGLSSAIRVYELNIPRLREQLSPAYRYLR